MTTGYARYVSTSTQVIMNPSNNGRFALCFNWILMTYAQSKKGICVFGHVRSNALLVFQNLKRAFTISLKITRKMHKMLCHRHLSRTKRAFVFFKHVRSNALLVFTSMEKGICYLFQNLSKFEITKLFMLALLAYYNICSVITRTARWRTCAQRF